MAKYLFWNEVLRITRYSRNLITLTVRTEEKGDFLSKQNLMEYRINETGAEIISLIDGTKTYNEVINILVKKYSEESSSIEKKVSNFLTVMKRQFEIDLCEQEWPIHKNIVEYNKNVISPLAASIEITNKCNIRCIHCYGDFGEVPSEIMELSNVKKVLNDLKKIGVRIIEITGGEATTHPDISDIMEYAFSLKFDQVSLLSNGVNINDKLFNTLIAGKDKLLVQIDLHSLDEEYFTWFTKVPNILEKVKSNIERLSKNNVRMRIATILTRKNIDELEHIADWTHNQGIYKYAVSPVVSLGRADESEKKSDLYLNIDDAMRIETILQKINKKYPNFLNIITNEFEKQINCGCMTSHLVIASDGSIKLCTMDNMHYFDSCIGNAFEKEIKDIFEDNCDFLNTLYTTKAPKLNSDDCRNCSNSGFCNGCLLRGILKAKEMGDKCLWYKNTFPEQLKEKLKI